jgi:ribosomal protein L29
MDNKDLKNLDIKSLKGEIDSLRKELFDLKLNASSGQLKDSSQFRKIRVSIAQALTYLRQKEKEA